VKASVKVLGGMVPGMKVPGVKVLGMEVLAARSGEGGTAMGGALGGGAPEPGGRVAAAEATVAAKTAATTNNASHHRPPIPDHHTWWITTGSRRREGKHHDCSKIDATMLLMRTTVTLDEDVAAKLKMAARERGVSFKQALNDAVRAGLSRPSEPRAYRLPTFHLGLRSGVNLDKALRLAAELEDAEVVHKLELRK